MKHTEGEILAILDACADAYTFPMLDNGYVYLAATRLTLFRSATDWGLTIEVVGFNPRAGAPYLCVHAFGSDLRNRDTRDDYVSDEAYRHYLAKEPFDQPRFFHPIDDAWQDEEEHELVRLGATTALIRGTPADLPSPERCEALGIELSMPPRLRTFEALRGLAATHRASLLATETELRHAFADDLERVLQLDDWRHPDVANDERPSGSATFEMLARVLVTAVPAAGRWPSTVCDCSASASTRVRTSIRCSRRSAPSPPTTRSVARARCTRPITSSSWRPSALRCRSSGLRCPNRARLFQRGASEHRGAPRRG
ncbi:MAG: hypothetical protein KC656_17095 [Myxococcales bacterium]|nr:hypothetical protein [Myxococcales bacterium]